MNKSTKFSLKQIDLLLIAKLRFNASIWLCFVGLLLITTLLFLNSIIQDWFIGSVSENINLMLGNHRWQLVLLIANTVMLFFSFRNYNRTIRTIREMV